MIDARLRTALRDEIERHRAARLHNDASAAWAALERAHILSQPMLDRHLQVHLLMLRFAVRTGDTREVAGQLARLLLAPIGALTGRLPWGNTGRSNVSAFQPMPIPADLGEVLARRERTLRRP